MKPPFLFFRYGILALAWMVLGSYAPAHPAADKDSAQTFYYWYWQDGDTLIDYNSTSAECSSLSFMTGTWVSTDPSAGTRVANGYINNAHPHTVWPTVILYSH